MLMFMELHVSDPSVSIIFSGSKTVSVSLGKLALKEDMTVKQRPSSYFFCMAKDVLQNAKKYILTQCLYIGFFDPYNQDGAYSVIPLKIKILLTASELGRSMSP